ncbi:hypothetical protein V9K67_09405 [Paraflavisolibacter sp. H34]|uniref:hypothetical protein n=1 Tax=Huijunlia imazamoxiresistens TaxID=3127457 RepID=UPI0030190DB9
MMLLSALLAACGKWKVFKTPSNPDNKETRHAACYIYLNSPDSIHLQIIFADNGIKGTLLYGTPGREGQGGFFSGYIKGDTLFAEYTFKANGRTGVREVAFLRTMNGLLEGTGPTETRDGKTVYSHPSALTFPEERLLKVVTCPGTNRK